jgi:hypothetical protein
MERVDLFSASRKPKLVSRRLADAYCQQETGRSSSRFCYLGALHLCGVSFAQRSVGIVSLPSTTKESVPRVSEAFLPTASVSGTFICSCVDSEVCDGCEGAALVVRGSLKGSSEPAIEAMVIGRSQESRTACCVESRTRKQLRN